MRVKAQKNKILLFYVFGNCICCTSIEVDILASANEFCKSIRTSNFSEWTVFYL